MSSKLRIATGRIRIRENSEGTTYQYTNLVPICQNVVRLTPRNDARQACTYHRLIVLPSPGNVHRRSDSFGNAVHDFSIHEGHRLLLVTAVSKVEVQPVSVPHLSASWAWEEVRDALAAARSPGELQAYEFCFDSPRAGRAAELADYARQSFPPGRPVLAAAAN